MPAWFAKYGFPIEAVYVVKPEGGAMIRASATVELVKTTKNIWTKKREIKEEERQKAINETMIAYAEERIAMMY